MGQIFVNGIQYSGELTDASNIKYAGAASGISSATVQGAIDELASASVQSDWNSQDATKKWFIKNKPAIKSGYRNGSVMVGPNAADNGTYLLAVGTGGSAAANAHTLEQNGNAWFKGSVFVGGTGEGAGSSKLATETYVNTQRDTRAPLSHKHSAADLTGGYMEKPGYLSLHPENADVPMFVRVSGKIIWL